MGIFNRFVNVLRANANGGARIRVLLGNCTAAARAGLRAIGGAAAAGQPKQQRGSSSSSSSEAAVRQQQQQRGSSEAAARQ